MNDRIHALLGQMSAVEDELPTALNEQETRMLFQIEGKRVEFERRVRDAHYRLKRKFLRWRVTDRPQNLITGPVIYGMGVPLVLLDICITVYQALCFPIAADYQARLKGFRVGLADANKSAGKKG